MTDGSKTVLENDKIVISKKGVRFATGTLCPLNDMIAMDDIQEKEDRCCSSTKAQPPQKNLLELHSALRHCGKNAVKLTFGLTEEAADMLNCIICYTTKSRQRDVPKVASNPPSELLEIVELDIQGPFPVAGADGTR